MHNPRSVDLQWILKDIRIKISYLTILYVYRPIHANGESDAIFRFSRTGSFDPDLSFLNINKGCNIYVIWRVYLLKFPFTDVVMYF